MNGTGWGLVLLCGTVFLSQGQAAETSRKNIVFILADDQRNDVLGCYGNDLIQTPTIDQLASNGVRFENFFCETPICSASRATLISGLSQRTHGYNFGEPAVDANYIPTSYPAYLKASGYRTGFTGKYGFRFSKNDRKQQFDFFKPYDRNPYLKKMPDGSLRHETDLCADAAIEFIKGNPKGQPFCLSVSFNASHAEDSDLRPGFHFQWPESTDGLYEEITLPSPKLGDDKYFEALPGFLKDEGELSRARYFWRWDTPEKYQVNLRAYFRMITGIDNAVARILAELKTQGLDQNTVVVYTGDNGFLMADRGLAGKWNHYDQSLHVPFIVYDPALPEHKRGRVVTELGTHLDVAPTIVEWAGLSKPAVYQGRSLVGLVEDGLVADWPQEVYCEHKFKRYNNWYGVRGKRYKYAVYYEEPDGPYECLYDLEKDPAEVANLAANPEYADVRKDMVRRLDAYLNAFPEASGKPDNKE
ncbi:Arylsulfatase [Pontiella desulfatans]|uniref:Arylsulfatase n=1 Tax=Pontiella desulfatans TaxID=2750659 RepID=A0A6C2TZD7_PONDE|nr:sulfatase [Pontiella desulfatans]SPS73680.1 sulfatase S1_25 [Kiritimatiellales bacterium]VGO12546.1 Arylsulfatase [Pontiella desulfatans]